MIEKNLKVLFLPSWYPSKNDPLNGIFIKRHALAVSKLCDVIVLQSAADPNLEEKTYDVEFLEEDGLFTVSAYYKISDLDEGLTSKIKKLFRRYRGISKGLKLIEEKYGKPDLVHVNVAVPMGFLALILKLIKRTPYIVTEHWSGYLPDRYSSIGRLDKIIASLVIKNASAVTTVSRSLEQAMKFQGLDNDYYIVPNVITFYGLPLRQKRNHERKIILHVSFLTNNKNIEGIIRAIKNLLHSRKDFGLHIVGDGKDRNFLESLVKELKLENYVTFHGKLFGSELQKHYNESDFFILNSNYETFSVVTAEAIASGLPVIVTRSGGPEEFVTEDVGIVIEPKNQKELENAITYMLDNYQIYDKEKLCNYAHSKFNSEVIGKKFFDIYKKILLKNLIKK